MSFVVGIAIDLVLVIVLLIVIANAVEIEHEDEDDHEREYEWECVGEARSEPRSLSSSYSFSRSPMVPYGAKPPPARRLTARARRRYSAGMKEERFTGCLLGLGAGDALGAPIEFMSAEQVRIKHGIVRDMIGGGWLQLRPGETTDDTAMALALARSLLEKGGYDRADAARRYVEWFRTNPPDVGNTVRASLSRIAEGMAPDEASALAHTESGGRSAGNGALMRCAPLALAFPRDPDALVAHALSDARLTHHDPAAGWASAGWALLIAAALGEEKDKARLPALAAEALSARGAPSALPDPSGKRDTDLNPTGYALDTFECALWAFLRGKSFEECLVLAVNLGGDADTVGAVCGALAGAWHGAAKIPARWLKPLDRRQALEEAGRKFFERARPS